MPRGLSDELVIVSTSSDDAFAIDLAFALGQREDIADLISLKTFANGEFCPRFISDVVDGRSTSAPGHQLDGARVLIVSTAGSQLTRQDMAMRNLLVARAAKENGALEVVLVEPDLFYSAQDRGARPELGATDTPRDEDDVRKFDGQPFSAGLYVELLELAGVSRVVTVHNHSEVVEALYREKFGRRFHNIVPTALYADYLQASNIVDFADDGTRLALCAPDAGAREFVASIADELNLPNLRFVTLDKKRTGERDVSVCMHPKSAASLEDIAGYDVVLMDDMVRTGSTVIQAAEFLRQANPRRVVFAVTHFYASEDGRQKMAHSALDEILTTNTIPTVLNRDVQGRLRRKMTVLKIERWLARHLEAMLELPPAPDADDGLYQIDMSSKNPRFTRRIWSNAELPDLARERSARARDDL